VDFADEVVLKIWHWKNENWILNSRIDRPHETELVTSMAFSPRPLDDAEDYVLLTAGANGILRTWRPQETHDGDGTYFGVIICETDADRTL
jgi:NET1-associated nuclear protein 1 (U3 small nucleolar RNA-associated protein 17)